MLAKGGGHRRCKDAYVGLPYVAGGEAKRTASRDDASVRKLKDEESVAPAALRA